MFSDAFPFVERLDRAVFFCRSCSRLIRRGERAYAPSIGRRLCSQCTAREVRAGRIKPAKERTQ